MNDNLYVGELGVGVFVAYIGVDDGKGEERETKTA